MRTARILGTCQTFRAPSVLRFARSVVATLALLATLCRPAPALAGNNTWNGVYELDELLTFYVVNDAGSNFTCTINWRNNWETSMDTPLLARVLDPQEHIIARHLEPGERITGTPGWSSFILPITATGGPGVYQVIITGFGGSIDFDINPQLPWGVYGYPRLCGENHLEEAYIYLPPGVSSLDAQCSGTINQFRLTDGNGIVHMNISGANVAGACPLPAGENQVWRLNAQGTGVYGVTFGSAPIIACPDQATALAIRASVDVLADGTVCFHKFQVEAHDVLAEYRALSAASFAVNPPNLTASLATWLSEPSRYSLLVGPYGVYSALPATLAEQNLDPESPWFGAIFEWHYPNGTPKPNPWLTCDRGGMSDPAPGIAVLAAVHAINDPVNPLYHDVQLRNRISIAALQQMMMIREHESPETTYQSYDGLRSIGFARFTRAFPWAIQQCPNDVRSIWTEGLRRYVDHMVLTAVPEIANQWSFIMLGLQHFASGTQEPVYQGYVQKHIDWMLSRRMFDCGASPAGYFSEGCGPEATYAGIHMHNLAWLCEEANSAELKEAVLASFTLFDHTVAPEPDGTWLGACSFNHRTSGDWTSPQWTAGVGMLSDDSHDAAVMLGHVGIPWKPAQGPSQIAQAQNTLQNSLTYLPVTAYSNPTAAAYIFDGIDMHMAVWEHYMGTPLSGNQLPMKADDRFTRNLGDEFMCVRRPTYYAMIYCGKSVPSWQQTAQTDPNAQWPRNGGGLSMLWSPRLGSSILAKNWSAYSSNALIAQRGGTTYFEGYWSVDATLQASQSRATINGQLTDNNLSYRRRFEFEEDRIIGELRITSSAAMIYDRVWECFPYPLDKPEDLSVKLYDAQGHHIPGNNVQASAIVFRNSSNETHVFAFKDPRLCDVGTNISTDVYGQQREIGRVLTRLPLGWTANQTRVVKWAMRVVKPSDVSQTVRQLVQSLQ